VGPAVAEVGLTSLEELFYSDLRTRLDSVWHRLGKQQASGTLQLQVHATGPKGAIPGEVLSQVLMGFEERLNALIVGRKGDIEWTQASDLGNYTFQIQWNPVANVPESQLAPKNTNWQDQHPRTTLNEGSMSQVSKTIDGFLRSLPEAPAARLTEIANLYRELRKQIAPVLGASIADRLQHSGELSYDEKVEISHEINQVLSDAKLAIRDPKTNLPGMLVAQRPRVNVRTSYLRIQDSRKADDGKRHFYKVEDLKSGDTVVELMDAAGDEPEKRLR
jgi:hypothetical protein